MKTLIAGCSFVNNLKSYEINQSKFALFGSPGAGNLAIAARCQHELTCGSYDRAVVLWSGVNRIDLAVPMLLNQMFAYRYTDKVGDLVWYHSGGLGCSGQSNESPQFFKNYLDKIYRCLDNRYLSQITINAILGTQSLLNISGIDYKMSFVYDQTSAAINKHEMSHGRLNPDVQGFDRIDWTKFAAISPHQWAKDRKQLDINEYYPQKQAFLQWFKDQLDIDLTV